MTRTLMILTVALFVTKAQATLISNGSFEDPDIAANGFSDANTLPVDDWGTSAGASNPFVLDNTSAGTFFTAAGAPDGTQVMTLRSGTATNSFINQRFVNGGDFVAAADGLIFDITFNAGRRSDGTPAFGSTPGTFTVFLQEYDTTLPGFGFIGNVASQSYYLGADDSNAATIDLNVAVGDWSSLVTVRLTTAGTAGGANRVLGIAFADAHGTTNVRAESSLDNITVIAVPEPASAGLSLFALAGMHCGVRSRRMRK